jgi:hypothetical protein
MLYRLARREARVRAALRAVLDRLDAERRPAALCACRERARCEAPARPSRFKALLVARDLLVEGRLRFDLWVLPAFLAEAVPLAGGGNFTPAFLAFDNPIAIACFEFFTPCFPSRT